MTCDQCNKPISRSAAQNRYLHKVLSIWGNEAGYALEEMKCLVKKQLGLFHTFPDKSTGEELIAYESSRDWDKGKFARVTEWIIQEAGSQGVHLLTPEEFYNQ